MQTMHLTMSIAHPYPRTSFPLSPLACHSAFLSGDLATGFNLSELFRPFQTCDICSIQVSTIPLSHSLLVSTHILDQPCHIFVPLGISVPDFNFDIFHIGKKSRFFLLIFLRIPNATGMFSMKGYRRYWYFSVRRHLSFIWLVTTTGGVFFHQN